MGFVRNAEELILLRALGGMAGGIVSATNALVAAAIPRQKSGFGMGLMQVAIWSGLGVGPFIGGPLADSYGFAMPFHCDGLYCMLSPLV